MLEVGGGARLSDAPPWESRCFLALLALLRERRLALSPAACLSAFERLHGNSSDRSSLALARQAPAGAICASVLSDFNRLRRHFGSCDRAQPPSCRGLWRSVADAALPPRFRFRFRLSGRTGGSEGLAPPIAGTRMRRGFSSRRRQPQSRYGRTWRIGRPGSKAPPLRRRCQMGDYGRKSPPRARSRLRFAGSGLGAAGASPSAFRISRFQSQPRVSILSFFASSRGSSWPQKGSGAAGSPALGQRLDPAYGEECAHSVNLSRKCLHLIVRTPRSVPRFRRWDRYFSAKPRASSVSRRTWRPIRDSGPRTRRVACLLHAMSDIN